jgi:hypothetical protein
MELGSAKNVAKQDAAIAAAKRDAEKAAAAAARVDPKEALIDQVRTSIT